MTSSTPSVPTLRTHGLSYGTCDISVDHVFGDQVPIFVDVAILPPTGVVMAAAAMSERAVPRLREHDTTTIR